MPCLCDDDLYFNAADLDGETDPGGCTAYHCVDHAFGPSWNVGNDPTHGCPFDDPGFRSSLGPNADYPGSEEIGFGFAHALDLSTGSGEYMQVYVR